MNKWIYTALVAAGLIVGVTVGFLLSNNLVLRPVKKTYEWQIKQLIEQNTILAKVPKYLIESTLTVKKVKKGSTIYYEPTSAIQAIEFKNGLDSLVNIKQPPDTVTTQKTFWQKLKFW